jgi:hypothetical protein
LNVWRTIIGWWFKRPQLQLMVPITATGSGRKWPITPDGIKHPGVVIHHSFGVDGKTRDWDAVKKYHMSFRYKGDIITESQYEEYKKTGYTAGLERPWKDIAYHVGIEDVNGILVVQYGRLLGTLGAHTIGTDAQGRRFNEYIGVCMVGNFDKVAPGADRLFLGKSMCRDFQDLFGFDRNHVVGHRETFTLRGVPIEKTCPGTLCDMVKFREGLN